MTKTVTEAAASASSSQEAPKSLFTRNEILSMVGGASLLGIGTAWAIRPMIQKKREEQATRTAEFYGETIQKVYAVRCGAA